MTEKIIDETIWNYRVVFYRGTYAVYEIFFNEEGKATTWTRASAPMGNNPEELMKDAIAQMSALDKPIMLYHELTGEKNPLLEPVEAEVEFTLDEDNE